MKKSVFYYLFAVICTVCLFTACSDDDDDDNKVLTVDNIVGTYPGDLDVTLAGTTSHVASIVIGTGNTPGIVKLDKETFTLLSSTLVTTIDAATSLATSVPASVTSKSPG